MMRCYSKKYFFTFFIICCFASLPFFAQQSNEKFTTKGTISPDPGYDAGYWQHLLEMSLDSAFIRWEEGFGSVAPPDSIWRIIDADGSGSGWEYRNQVDFVSGFSILPHADTLFLFSRFNRANAQGIIDEWIISPQLPAIQSEDYLYIHAGAIDEQFPDSLYIYISTTDTQQTSFTNEIAALQVKGPGGAWNRYRFDMSSYIGESPYIAVNYYHENGGPGSPNSDNVWVDHFILGKLSDIAFAPGMPEFDPPLRLTPIDTVITGIDTTVVPPDTAFQVINDTLILPDTLSLSFFNLGSSPLQVLNITSNHPQFFPDTTRGTIPAFSETKFHAIYTPDSLNPVFEASFTVQTNDIVQNTLEIPFSVKGFFPPTGIAPRPIPEVFSLGQNYPNPFNPVTYIDYQLQIAADVKLEVFNILGQKVRTLVNTRQSPGSYTAQWNGRNDFGAPVASGIYIYRFQTPRQVRMNKMILLR